MKRRSFLASLFVLPLAAKPLEALARSDDSDVPTTGDIQWLMEEHRIAIDRNAKVITKLSDALLLNAPSGYKVVSSRYSPANIRALGNRRWR